MLVLAFIGAVGVRTFPQGKVVNLSLRHLIQEYATEEAPQASARFPVSRRQLYDGIIQLPVG